MQSYDFLLETRLKKLNSELAYRHNCCMGLFEMMLKKFLATFPTLFVMCMQITSVSSVIGVKELLSATDGISNAVIGILVAIVCYFAIGTLGEVVITRMGRRKHIKSRDYLENAEIR